MRGLSWCWRIGHRINGVSNTNGVNSPDLISLANVNYDLAKKIFCEMISKRSIRGEPI